jgi:hypothetical protein
MFGTVKYQTLRYVALIHFTKVRSEIIEVRKGVWGMPRLSKAKKDVVSCEKLRGSANRN